MSYSQDNELSGMPLGLMEQARHGLVNKIKVQNNAYQTGSGLGGGLVGMLGGGLAGLLAARKGLRRFSAPAGALGGGLVGGVTGRAAGGLMGTSIPAAVDQPMTPETIGAVSKFISKQAGLMDQISSGADAIGQGVDTALADPKGSFNAAVDRVSPLVPQLNPLAEKLQVGDPQKGFNAAVNQVSPLVPKVNPLAAKLRAWLQSTGLVKQSKLLRELNKIASQMPTRRQSAIKVAIGLVKQGHSLESALRTAYPGKKAMERIRWCNNIKAAAEAQH